MSPSHVSAIRDLAQASVGAALATEYLSPEHPEHGESVPDPFGSDPVAYEKVAVLLEECVSAIMDRIEEFE
jgi:hypothetical protein